MPLHCRRQIIQLNFCSMKYIVSICLLSVLMAGAVLLGCRQIDKNAGENSCRVDTVFVPVVDSACCRVVDSLQAANDVLAGKLLHSRMIVENARYYVRIVERNPKQKKFLYGWMRRVLN